MRTAVEKRIPEFTFGDRMAKARESAGYSRRDLADALGISSQSLVDDEQARIVVAGLTLEAA